jgi:hypothetical protein
MMCFGVRHLLECDETRIQPSRLICCVVVVAAVDWEGTLQVWHPRVRHANAGKETRVGFRDVGVRCAVEVDRQSPRCGTGTGRCGSRLLRQTSTRQHQQQCHGPSTNEWHGRAAAAHSAAHSHVSATDDGHHRAVVRVLSWLGSP